ncbi:MAG: CDP-diacylglycerol--glycerol-3-phosphate 3-phosphatidyltransferase [Proteobacteria bacterium]|nr:CDP-diacylglycerol--glycerol-3-phosphate 3-phosphatidyltransferase [Pseudomonadota bacterium]
MVFKRPKIKRKNPSVLTKRIHRKTPPKQRVMASSIRKDIFNIPNSITMLRIIFIPFVVVFLALKTPLFCILAVACFSIAAISDFFDGYLARKLNLVSVTGKFLDPLADKLMVMAATVQLAAMGWLDAWIPIVLLARELAVQGMRQMAVAEGLVIAAGTGGKLKTALQLVGLVGLLAHYTYPIHIFGYETTMNFHKAGLVLLVLSVFISIISMFQYFWGFMKSLEKRENTQKA